MLGLSMRQPPTNLQAEQALLGAMMANSKAYDAVSNFLSLKHFADPIHGAIYIAASRLIEAGGVADVVTLKQRFEHTGELQEVGGVKYLAELLSAMVGIVNARDYGLAIVEAWRRRELIAIGETLVNNAFGADPDLDAKAIGEQAEAALYALAQDGEAEDKSAPAHVAMLEAIEEAHKAAERPGGLAGLTSGFKALDDLTGGLKPGHLALLAARPSMGKTQLGLGVSAGAAQAGGRALFISNEMTVRDIGASLAAGLSGVPRDAAERGRVRERDAMGRWTWPRMTQDHIDRMLAAQRAMAERRLVIVQGLTTLPQIRARVRRECRRGGLDLVVIDYLGLLRAPEVARFGNRVAEISAISNGLKRLALDLDIPVLALAQLNRALESREEKRPMLADLRDSGELEQDADLVMFLHRDHYYLRTQKLSRKPGEAEEHYANRLSQLHTAEQASVGVAEVIVAKNRRGRTGMAALRFDDESAWFSDMPMGDD